MQADLMGELSGAFAARKQKSGQTPASAVIGSQRTASVAENASPQTLSGKQLFGKNDDNPRTPQDGNRPPPRRPGSARKLPSVAGICVDGEFFGGKVRSSPFKPDNDSTPTSGSTPTFFREETPKGQKAEALAVLAERKRAVDATSLIVQTEFGDGEPSIRNRPKRSEQAVQRVMEARREHISAMEEELKRNSAAGAPVIDADMALAMGGQLVHKMEKKEEQSSVKAEHCKTPTPRKKTGCAALSKTSTLGATALKTGETGSTSKPTTPAPAPLQGWTCVPNTPIGKPSSSSSVGNLQPEAVAQAALKLKVGTDQVKLKPPGAAEVNLSSAGKQEKEPTQTRHNSFGRGLGQSAGNLPVNPGTKSKTQELTDLPARAVEGKGEALMRRKQEELRRQLENTPSPGRNRVSLAGAALDLLVTPPPDAHPPLSGLDLEASALMSPEMEAVMDLQVEDDDGEGGGLLLEGLQLESDD